MKVNAGKSAGRVLAIFAGVLLFAVVSSISSVPLLAETSTDFGVLPPLLPGNESVLIAEGALGEYQVRVFSTLEVVPADGETEAELAVRITDKDGSPALGRFVSLSFREGDGFLIPNSPLTDETGQATFTYRAGKVALTNIISVLDVSTGASFDFTLPTSLSAVLTIELVDPIDYQRQRSASVLTPDVFDLELSAFPDVLVADGISLSRITARLTYKDGKPAVGFPVIFRIASGFGSLSQDQKLTNKDGYIEALFQASERVGNVLIEALEQTTGKSANVEITVLKAGPAKLKLSFADDALGGDERALVPADGATRVEIVAQVLSLADTPVSGVEVRFKLKNDLGRLEPGNYVTDSTGEVRVSFVAGRTVGVEELTAFVISATPQD